MKNALLITGLALFGFALGSCTKDESFNSGWDASLENEVTLDNSNTDDISMGTVDLDDAVMNYLEEIHGEVKTYTILSVTPTSGGITTVNVEPLDFLDALDVYAVADGTETLIGMTNPATPGDASRGMDLFDIDLTDLADDDDQIEFIVRPTFDQGSAPTSVAAEVKLNFAFVVDGVK